MNTKLKSFLLMTFSLSFVLLGTNANGQISNTTSKSVKLYSNFSRIQTTASVLNLPGPEVTVTESTNFDFGYFTPGLCFHEINGNFYEFGINRLAFNRTDYEANNLILDSAGTSILVAGIETNTTNIVLNYEYNIRLFKKSESKLNTFIGIGASPHFKRTSSDPKTSNSFPVATTDVGIIATITPRITYNINENWYLDLNIPFQFADLNFSTNKVENPAFSVEQRKQSTFEMLVFPNTHIVRFGVGFRI